MGFLSRKSVVRICINRKNRNVKRGYEYQYSFTKKGREYVKWLKEVKPNKDSIRDNLMINIMNSLDKDKRNLLIDNTLPGLLSKFKGPGKRHPVEKYSLTLCSMLIEENNEMKLKMNEYEVGNLYLIVNRIISKKQFNGSITYLRSGDLSKKLKEELIALSNILDKTSWNSLYKMLIIYELLETINIIQTFLKNKLDKENQDIVNKKIWNMYITICEYLFQIIKNYESMKQLL